MVQKRPITDTLKDSISWLKERNDSGEYANADWLEGEDRKEMIESLTSERDGIIAEAKEKAEAIDETLLDKAKELLVMGELDYDYIVENKAGLSGDSQKKIKGWLDEEREAVERDTSDAYSKAIDTVVGVILSQKDTMNPDLLIAHLDRIREEIPGVKGGTYYSTIEDEIRRETPPVMNKFNNDLIMKSEFLNDRQKSEMYARKAEQFGAQMWNEDGSLNPNRMSDEEMTKSIQEDILPYRTQLLTVSGPDLTWDGIKEGKKYKVPDPETGEMVKVEGAEITKADVEVLDDPEKCIQVFQELLVTGKYKKLNNEEKALLAAKGKQLGSEYQVWFDLEQPGGYPLHETNGVTFPEKYGGFIPLFADKAGNQFVLVMKPNTNIEEFVRVGEDLYSWFTLDENTLTWMGWDPVMQQWVYVPASLAEEEVSKEPTKQYKNPRMGATSSPIERAGSGRY
jgi:hypothetical protein